MKNYETRALQAIENVEEMLVEGYALRFNTMSKDLGGFQETIAPEALKDLDLSDVRCFLDHDSSKLLGRTTAGSLQLTVDEIGLKFRCELPNTSTGRDTYELVKRGDLNQCSFSFLLDTNGEQWRKDGASYVRTITKISRISEVSLVSIPAYDEANVAVAMRSLQETQEKEIMVERELALINLSLQLMAHKL